MGSEPSKLSLDGRQNLCLVSMDAQADLSLHWAHKQSCRKCCVPAHLLRLFCGILLR